MVCLLTKLFKSVKLILALWSRKNRKESVVFYRERSVLGHKRNCLCPGYKLHTYLNQEVLEVIYPVEKYGLFSGSSVILNGPGEMKSSSGKVTEN